MGLYMMRDGQRAKQGLRDLIRQTGLHERPFVMVELGSYAGESAEVFLEFETLETLYCIDRWTPNPDATVKNALPHKAEHLFDDRRTRWLANGRCVYKLKDDTSDAACCFPPDSVDIVYFDAAHKYAGICSELCAFYPIVKQGGWIAGHDWHIRDTQRAVHAIFGRTPRYHFCDDSWLLRKDHRCTYLMDLVKRK